mgnify:CR=1 FL=1
MTADAAPKSKFSNAYELFILLLTLLSLLNMVALLLPLAPFSSDRRSRRIRLGLRKFETQCDSTPQIVAQCLPQFIGRRFHL